MKKKLLALLMSALTVLYTCSSCAGAAGATLRMGEWLNLIAESFGMQSYTETKPFFSSVGSDDPLFPYFQMAGEWNILSSVDDVEKVTANTAVTWNTVLITLVNAGEFLKEDASAKEKVEYAIQHFDNSIRDYWGSREIKMNEAIPLLDKAQSLWAGRKFTPEEKVENVTYAENVKSFVDVPDFTYTRTNEKTVELPAAQAEGLKAGDIYTLPAQGKQDADIVRVKSIRIEGGKAVIENEELTEEEALEAVQEIQLRETSEPDFSQISAIYDEAGNPIPFEYDSGKNASPTAQVFDETDNGITLNTLQHRPDQAELQQTGLLDGASVSFSQKIGDYKFKLKCTSEGITIGAEKEISKGSSSSRFKSQKETLYGSFSIKKPVLTRDIDYKWGKLRSALVKLETDNTFEAGVKLSRTWTAGKVDNPDKDHKTQISTIIGNYKDALKDITDFSKEWRNSKAGKDKSDIYIAKIHLFGDSKVFGMDFIIKGKITVEGELKFVLEIDNATGLEYKNGSVRYIKSNRIDPKFVADAKIELLLGPGIAISAFSKIHLVEFVAYFGIGISFAATVHLFDREMHELFSAQGELCSQDAEILDQYGGTFTAEQLDIYAKSIGKKYSPSSSDSSKEVEIQSGICFDFKLYPIVRICVEPGTVLGKILKGFDVKAELELIGASTENTPMMNGHFDLALNYTNPLSELVNANGGLSVGLEKNAASKKCLFKFKPFDDLSETGTDQDGNSTTAPANDRDNIPNDKTIRLSSVRVFLKPNETAELQIIGLPSKYKLSDLEILYGDDKKSSDLVNFNEHDGLIEAKDKEGIEIITFRTKDKKHQTKVAVTIESKSSVSFTPLPANQAAA